MGINWKKIAKYGFGAASILFPQIGAAVEQADKIVKDPTTSNSAAVPALVQAFKLSQEALAEVSAEVKKLRAEVDALKKGGK